MHLGEQVYHQKAQNEILTMKKTNILYKINASEPHT